MGTRSTITFIEKWGEEVTPITTVYQQYDGYLDGVGYTLAKWLSGKVIVNGIPEYRKEYANGCSDLAAQFISVIKDETPGDIYIYPVDCDKSWIDYNYDVIVDDTKTERPIYIRVGNWGEEPFFIGTPKELLEYIKEHKEGE